MFFNCSTSFLKSQTSCVICILSFSSLAFSSAFNIFVNDSVIIVNLLLVSYCCLLYLENSFILTDIFHKAVWSFVFIFLYLVVLNSIFGFKYHSYLVSIITELSIIQVHELKSLSQSLQLLSQPQLLPHQPHEDTTGAGILILIL